MKATSYALGLFVLCCGIVSAEEEAAPQRRRPRIRVYDESPRLISTTRESESRQVSREDMDRRIRQDRPFSSGLQAPGGSLAPIPSLVEPQWAPQTDSSSEDRSSSWINPLDFLSEEDLYESDTVGDESTSDDSQPEMEITAWEDLQREMIKQTLSTRSEDERTMEELVEVSQNSNENSERDHSARGLDLESVAPVDSSESFNDSSTSRAERRERTDVSLFTPILRMEPRSRELPAATGSDRREGAEFSGSRALFNQIRDNREPAGEVAFPSSQPDRSFARPDFAPVESPSLPNRTRSAALPGAGFGGANVSPGPRPLPGGVGNARIPSTTMPDPGSSQRETERFRPSENRIRSQLGPADGRGF